MAHVTVAEDAEQLAATAAGRVTALIETAISTRQRAAFCLTGGRTPERLYEMLADHAQPWRHRIDWGRVHVFWGDERHVPPDHPDSNYGMAYRTLLSHVPIPADQIHRIHGERADAHEAAREYDAELRTVRLKADTTYSMFDIMLLGVGEDAHIASIFPGSPLLADSPELAAAVWVEHLNSWRITLTPPALLNSQTILVMTSGAGKANAVRAALTGPEDVLRYPAQLVRGAEWLIDRAAAQSLDGLPGR